MMMEVRERAPSPYVANSQSLDDRSIGIWAPAASLVDTRGSCVRAPHASEDVSVSLHNTQRAAHLERREDVL